MSQVDRTALGWMLVAGGMVGVIIVIFRVAAAMPSISATEAGLGFVATVALTLGVGAILFGLATDRI